MSTEKFVQGSAPEPTEKDWHILSVEHLQLDNSITKGLKSCGIMTVGEAASWAETQEGVRFRYYRDLQESLDQLRECCDVAGTDWARYWSLRRWQLHHLAAAAREFVTLAHYSGETVVSRELLGNAGSLIRCTGVADTLSSLVAALRSGMRPIRGLGRTKLEDLFRQLLSLSENAGATKRQVGPAPFTPTGAKKGLKLALSDDARALPLSVLHLGVKAELLRNAGYATVGDLADADWRDFVGIESLGPGTIRNLRERLEALSDAAGEGQVDWATWSNSQNVPLLPSMPVRSAAEMLDALPRLLADMTPHLRDEHYRLILAGRICRLPGEQITLEEIARSVRPHVTRERVRQKQTKLLRQIADAFIWGRGDGLEVHIHPSFSAWWSIAAAEFENEDDVSFPEFIQRLGAVWQVDHADVLGQISFICAVVTGDAQMPPEFRSGATLAPALLRLNAGVRATPLSRFRLGRFTEKLASRAIIDLGGLIDAALAGTLPWDLTGCLNQIGRAARHDGSLSWAGYQEAVALKPLPADSPANPDDFVAGLADTIIKLLDHISSSSRAAQIFDIRTRHPDARRPTLDSTARALGTYGSSIKREETVLLQELYKIIIEGNFSEVPYWIDGDWLTFCKEAEGLFKNAGQNYGWFVSALARSWELPIQRAELAAPGLWALLSGYPEGRARGAKRMSRLSAPQAQAIASRILLRGFRRLH